MTMKFTTIKGLLCSKLTILTCTSCTVYTDDITTLTDAIAGYVGGFWVPFKKTDVCASLTPGCPLKAGTTATYVFSLAISKSYPTVSDGCTVLTWSVLLSIFQINVPVKSNTKDSTDVCACFEMQGKIV